MLIDDNHKIFASTSVYHSMQIWKILSEYIPSDITVIKCFYFYYFLQNFENWLYKLLEKIYTRHHICLLLLTEKPHLGSNLLTDWICKISMIIITRLEHSNSLFWWNKRKLFFIINWFKNDKIWPKYIALVSPLASATKNSPVQDCLKQCLLTWGNLPNLGNLEFRKGNLENRSKIFFII